MRPKQAWIKNSVWFLSFLLLIFSAHAKQDAALNKKPVSEKKIGQDTKRAKGPYIIFEGKNTEMTLHWQGTESFKSQIKWGKDTTYTMGTDETEAYGDHQHRYTFKNLEPGELYYYSVSMDGEMYEGSFRAAPPDTATKLSFLAYGDTRSHPEVHNEVAAGMLSVFESQADFQTMVIVMGDLVKFGDVESQWKEQFFDAKYPKIQDFLSKISFQTTVGNHEMYGMRYKSIDPDFKRFKKYFPYPYVEHSYWSFDYGPVHFVMVDQYYYEFSNYQFGKLKKTLVSRARVVKSYEKKIRKSEKRGTEKALKKAKKLQKKRDKELAKMTKMKAEIASLEEKIADQRKVQLKWLENDLTSTQKQWKILVMHEPGWSAEGGHENNEEVQQFIHPLAKKYGVTAIFSGHVHYYARAVVDDIQYVTTGGGGAPFHRLNKKAPYLVMATQEHHFCKIDIDGQTMRFSAVKPDGTTIDSFTIQR